MPIKKSNSKSLHITLFGNKRKPTLTAKKTTKRKEAFLERDAAFLNSNPSVHFGARLDSGLYGEVVLLENNENMVAKAPKYFIHPWGETESYRKREVKKAKAGIQEELEAYSKYSLGKRPLFIPTHAVLMESDFDNEKYPVLLRPIVSPIIDGKNYKYSTRRLVTNEMLEDIRRKVITLSHEGIAFFDGLQLGLDETGRPLIFDAGRVRKTRISEAFETNNKMWRRFLTKLERPDLNVKGEINPRERY